jgi:hypothetical protein
MRLNIYEKQFIPSMISLDKEIRRLGINVDIINCSRTSALTCFKKEVIAELML